MVEFRWIQMSLFLILMLQFPAATEQYSSVTVRVGHDVTLSCGNVIDGQKNCNSTTWMYNYSLRSVTVALFTNGQIRSKSDRLSVTTNCSLVIKKVTAEDVGYYACRQFRSGQQQGADVQFYLSVLNMTQHENNNTVVLFCSVLDYGHCTHIVEWLYEGEEEISDMEISPQHFCSATVTFTTSHLNQRIYELLKCKVTNVYTNKVQLFTFSPQSSGEDATTKSPPTITTQGEAATTKSPPTKTPQAPPNSWLMPYVIVPVCLVAFFAVVFVVVIIKWKKTKGNKRETEGNTAGPEDGVCYASISHTKKTKSKAKGQGCDDDDDDEDGAVFYSTVNACSDPRDFYSTVSKPN